VEVGLGETRVLILHQRVVRQEVLLGLAEVLAAQAELLMLIAAEAAAGAEPPVIQVMVVPGLVLAQPAQDPQVMVVVAEEAEMAVVLAVRAGPVVVLAYMVKAQTVPGVQ
jgi:hypothetical protein